MREAIVALVGRPNVGKSALFNRMIGKSRAIVDDFPGLTRDRNYGRVEWLGRSFLLVDTGGFMLGKDAEPMQQAVQAQTRLAIEEADVILFVVDNRAQLTAADRRLAEQLRTTAKPVLLVANKTDQAEHEDGLHEFWSLGLGEAYPVSALHGRRVDEMLDAILEVLPPRPERNGQEEDLWLKLAIVGRPNVGKSSLVNRILGQERMVVSSVPGTTRDSVSSFFTYKDRTYQILDTAGLKSQRQTGAGLEYYATVRSLRSIEESNVVALLLDGTQPLSDQDEKLAGFIHESGRACILVINKWDVVEKDTRTTDLYTRILRKRLRFLDYAPIITLSAKTGQRVDRFLELAAFVDEQHVMRFKTSLLNETLREIVHAHPAPSRRGKTLQVKYISQTGVRPPAFALFVNDPSRMHFAYLRHLKNELRKRFGLEGTPLIFMLRGKEDKKGD